VSKKPIAARARRLVVIGAGIAGLVAALELAAHGLEVVVLERALAPGGKMRELRLGNAMVDAGPTVFTMRWVFDEIFDAAGTSLTDHVRLRPVEILARHAWNERDRLDLYADEARSADAIAALAGPAEGRRFREFSERARRIYATLETPFIRSARPSPLALVRGVAPRGLGDLFGIAPFETMWRALGEHFHDPRLRQLFGRYATYCGSSPFLAPATLMLVAHVEREGVWLVEGGMHRIAAALAKVAAGHGATFRYGAEVAEIVVSGGRATAVRLSTGELLEAAAVLATADVAAISGGWFGAAAARAVPRIGRAERSLSALTWAMVAATEGFPLLRHTVFFSGDYAAEFDDLLTRAVLPAAPTVYVCAQDRGDGAGEAVSGPERLLCLVNAPPTGDTHPFDASEVELCETRTFGLLERCGLRVHRRPDLTAVTTPADFERLFPGTGGALYGPASHGWMASFRRPGARTKLPGLYLAGGSTHPGPGVPMAALSGRLAAASALKDLASTSPSGQAATRGGTSTR
jgi:1-hydroxycarotenoid 3,4-desaturase